MVCTKGVPIFLTGWGPRRWFTSPQTKILKKNRSLMTWLLRGSS